MFPGSGTTLFSLLGQILCPRLHCLVAHPSQKKESCSLGTVWSGWPVVCWELKLDVFYLNQPGWNQGQTLHPLRHQTLLPLLRSVQTETSQPLKQYLPPLLPSRSHCSLHLGLKWGCEESYSGTTRDCPPTCRESPGHQGEPSQPMSPTVGAQCSQWSQPDGWGIKYLYTKTQK